MSNALGVLAAAIAVGAGIASGGLLPPATVAPAAPQAAQALKFRTLSPGDNLYVLIGGGGNTLALLRDDGTTLIDTKLPTWGGAIGTALNDASDQPVRTIVVTHAHADHTGGTPEFPTATDVISHQNARAAMERMEAFRGVNAKYLPNRTFADRLSLFEGRDRIDLYYFGRGHTDGDIVVVFPGKRIAYLGDLFPSKSAPVIDGPNGGSGVAFPATLARVVSEITGVTRVVTGHEEGLAAERSSSAVSVDISTPRTMTWNDLQEYADFNREFLGAVQAAFDAGTSAAEAASTLRLPDRFKNYDLTRAAANVEAIYTELASRR